MKQFEEWEGFKGRIWKKSIQEISSRKTTHLMMETKASLQDLQKQQISYGVSYRDFKKKNEKKVEFLTWIQISYLL